jgi:hypothetical protein
MRPINKLGNVSSACYSVGFSARRSRIRCAARKHSKCRTRLSRPIAVTLAISILLAISICCSLSPGIDHRSAGAYGAERMETAVASLHGPCQPPKIRPLLTGHRRVRPGIDCDAAGSEKSRPIVIALPLLVLAWITYQLMLLLRRRL